MRAKTFFRSLTNYSLPGFRTLGGIAALTAATALLFGAASPANMIAVYQRFPKPIAPYAFDRDQQLSSSGLTGYNKDGWLQVGFQHRAMVAMTQAAAEGDREVVERLWPAVSEAFSHQKPNGSFEMAAVIDGHPTRVDAEPTSDAFFMADLIQAFLLLQSGPLAEVYKDRLQVLDEPIRRAAIFMARPDSQHTMLLRDTPTADRLFVDAKALILAGYYTGLPAVIRAGHRILNVALSRQGPDGVFIEKGGADSGYNAISLLHLTEIAAFLDEPELRTALSKGFAWEQRRINPDGSISTEGNTRTGAGQEIYFGKAKTIHYREAIRAFALYGTLTNDQAAIDTALKIMNYAMAHEI